MPAWGELPDIEAHVGPWTPPIISYQDRPIPRPWDGNWLPPNSKIRTGCYTPGCDAVGWQLDYREICHCGEYVDAHRDLFAMGHSPVSMGRDFDDEPFEGWCPDHGFWWVDVEGGIKYMRVIVDHDPGDEDGR